MTTYTASAEVRAVPRVTLYVKDEDVPVWERARALAGAGDESLSALVTEGLRQRVEWLEARQKIDAGDITTITLPVGKPIKTLRFTGRLIASDMLGGSGEAQIYQMKDGRVLWFQEQQHEGNLYSIHDSLNDLKEASQTWAGAQGEIIALLEEAFDAAGEDFIIDLD